jgi:predicted phosphoribosyltransferase
LIREEEPFMAVAAVKRQHRRKMFYATMHVTRVEEWCVEAETEEEARELLNKGHGQRGHVGECIHCDVAAIEE